MQTDIGVGKYNMTPRQLVSADVSGAANGAVTTVQSMGSGVENPMLWLVGIGALTLGFVAFSTSFRVGKVTASASVG